MRRWTQHQPRENHLLDADQFQREQVAHRGSISSLDRTQVPTATTRNMFKDNALHRIWRFANAEQTRFKATGVSTTQWECMTFEDNYAPGYHTVLEETLDDHKGGMTFFEWSGAAFCNGVQGMRLNVGDRHVVERFINLRITVDGIIVAESLGVAAGVESFRITGSQLLPPGDLTVALQIKCTPPSPYDVYKNYQSPPMPTGASLMQYHVVNNVLVAIARFR